MECQDMYYMGLKNKDDCWSVLCQVLITIFGEDVFIKSLMSISRCLAIFLADHHNICRSSVASSTIQILSLYSGAVFNNLNNDRNIWLDTGWLKPKSCSGSCCSFFKMNLVTWPWLRTFFRRKTVSMMSKSCSANESEHGRSVINPLAFLLIQSK